MECLFLWMWCSGCFLHQDVRWCCPFAACCLFNRDGCGFGTMYERRERLDVGEWYCKFRNGLSFSLDACPFRQKGFFWVKIELMTRCLEVYTFG